MKTSLTILLTLCIAVPATWFATKKFRANTATRAESSGTERKLLYYQSAMHPWVKSDKPGRCTICGMELTPVYEGDAGFDASSGDIVPLTESMIQALNVQTATVKVQPLQKTLTVAGTIDDNATRHRVLSAYIPGRIEKLHVNYVGAEVKKDQPLADFYSPALLQAERDYRTVTGELRSSIALRLRQMGLNAEQIEALSDKPADKLTSQILAPISGTVVAQNVYEGQYVLEGEKLFEIADFSTMWFQFQAYEQDLPWIKPGLKVDVTTPSHPGKTFPGKITFIEPNFNEVTRTTRVRVELENPEEDGRYLLLHRLYADGLVHANAPEVLSVPRSAIIETGREAVAYVDQGGGAYARRSLVLGRRGDTLVEIISGLSADEEVVVNGNLLIDGQAEMNRAFEPAPAQTTSNALPALTDRQREALQSFLSFANALAAALAEDDLDRFNEQAAKSHAAMPQWMDAFVKSDPSWHPLLKEIEESGHIENAANLETARQAFHPLSKAAVALVRALRQSNQGWETLKIFRCPMTKSSFPGAPPAADWVQLHPDLRNPYMGLEMLDCGIEVK